MIARFLSKNGPLIILLLGIFFVGFAAIFTRLAECHPIAAAFWRSALTLPMLIPIMLTKSNRGHLHSVPVTSILKILLVGMIFGLDIAIWNLSLCHTTIANAAFLSTTTPLFIILIAWIFSWHPLNIKIWLGLVITLLGSLIMTLGSTNLQINWQGDSLAMLSASMFAIYLIFVTQLLQKINLWIILFFANLGACLVLGLGALGLNSSLAIPNMNTLFWLFALSFFSQILGQGLVTASLKHFSSSFSALALTLTPVVCVIAAWFIFHEPLSVLQCLGMILIILGIYYSKQKYDSLVANKNIEYGN